MTRTIHLANPIQGPRGKIGKITLRAPTYGDYRALGEPFTAVSTGNGGQFFQETSEIIAGYIERLADIDPNLLELLSLEDTLTLREAVHDFFREARTPKSERAKSSPPSDGSSSSASDSTRGPSTI